MDTQFPHNITEQAQSARTQFVSRAGRVATQVRERMVDTGHRTDRFVRAHPGRFIAGACCFGLAAGWLLGRSGRQDRP